MDPNVDSKKLKDIINKRLAFVSPSMKHHFPAILQNNILSWVIITKPEYLMIVFLSPEDMKRINDFKMKQLDPFPGLITNLNQNAVFRVDKSRNMLLKDCSINNSYALSLGIDSTIILEDLRISVDTKAKESSVIKYSILLAYIISYGIEINKATIYEDLEGLVAYSITMWRKEYEE